MSRFSSLSKSATSYRAFVILLLVVVLVPRPYKILIHEVMQQHISYLIFNLNLPGEIFIGKLLLLFQECSKITDIGCNGLSPG
jgi:hypothetical protein